MTRPPITAALVVVPAHNEQERIGRCLRSIGRATAGLRLVMPDVRVATTVVLDACSDETGRFAGRFPDVDLVSVSARSVGVARHAGVRHGQRRLTSRPCAVLVVNTDADCEVPETWLIDLVRLARDHDLVLGEVEPDSDELSPAALSLWWDAHPVGRGSLHGANLAVRLDAYLAAGGFPELAQQEDLMLVRALRANGASVVGGTRVVTSGRLHGRAPRGFASYLRSLEAQVAARDVTAHAGGAEVLLASPP